MTHRIKMNADGSKEIRQTTKTVQQAIRDARLYGLPVETRDGSNFVVIGDQVFVGEPRYKLDAHEFVELVVEEFSKDPGALRTVATAGKRVRDLLDGQDPYRLLHAMAMSLSSSYVMGTKSGSDRPEEFLAWVKRTRIRHEDAVRDATSARMAPPPASISPKRNPPKAAAKAQPEKAAAK